MIPSNFEEHTAMTEEMKVDTILLATDYSARSAAAERFAVELAAKFGSALHVVSAIEPIIGVGVNDEDRAEFDDFYQKLIERSERELESRVVEWSKRKVMVRQHVSVGQRWRVVLETANQIDADLIVMGRRRYDASTSLGTTSHKVFVGATCPVLLVPGETT